MIPSGIPPFDTCLGGAVPGRIHLLTGGPGAGKSTACLQFLGEGLRRGESVALLTSLRPSELRAHAAHLGLDLMRPLHDGRLVLLRYRSGFSARLQHAAEPRAMLDDLRRLALTADRRRVVIDPVSPFLIGTAIPDSPLATLVEMVEDTSATVFVTYAGEVTAGRGASAAPDAGPGYDPRLEPLVERAIAIVRLARVSQPYDAVRHSHLSGATAHRFEVVRTRHAAASAAWMDFSISSGAGIVATEPPRPVTGYGASPGRLLVLGMSAPPSQEIVALLRPGFDVLDQELGAGAPIPDPRTERAAAVIVEVRHETLEAAAALVGTLTRHPHVVPLIAMTRFTLRSADRARLLRAGADEFLAGDMGAAELLERLTAAVQRGHLRRPTDRPPSSASETLPLQPMAVSSDGGHHAPRYRPLDRDGFTNALAAHVAQDSPTRYTVVHLAPASAPGDSGEMLRELATHAMRSMRAASGDLAAIADGGVLVYLHGTRRQDAEPFVERVRELWSRRGAGTLRAESLSYPSDEPQLRSLIGVPREAQRVLNHDR